MKESITFYGHKHGIDKVGAASTLEMRTSRNIDNTFTTHTKQEEKICI